MKVLSLFDGIAGARQALKELNINCEYFACEIDRFAIQIAKNNHPDIFHFGYWQDNGVDVKDLLCKQWEEYADDIQIISQYKKQKELLLENKIDLLIGGSPCQDLSIAKRGGKGLDGERSGLFYEYLRILKEVKPRFFILENVASMKNADRDKITELLGVQPVMINSALLTAQQRKRYYWVGKNVNGKYETVDIVQPKQTSNFIEIGESYCYATIGSSNNRTFRKTEKLGTLTASIFKGVRAAGRPLIAHKSIIGQHIDSIDKSLFRMLTPIECERLQGFPDNYTNGVSNTQRYKALGNSFTVPVIKHIINNL